MMDGQFLIRLLINLVSVFVLVRCYYAFTRHRENVSSFMLFGLGVFLVTALLHSVSVSMGFALGLFAIFSMLRYRTEALGIKEMTYLFLVIAMALLGAVGDMPHVALVVVNALVIGAALLLETRVLMPLRAEQVIEYENIELIRPDQREALVADLKSRTGLAVTSVEVTSVSFLKDTAMLRVHYVPESQS